jgi:hypothetical protein
MENLDLIIMTSAVVLCFWFFFVSTFKAFENAADAKCPLSTNRKELFQDFCLFAKLSYGVIINLKCYKMNTIPEQFQIKEIVPKKHLFN